MAKLSKSNIYAIKWLNHIGQDIDDISSELKLTKDQVLGAIEKNQPAKVTTDSDTDPIKTASKSTAKKIISKNLMINQTSSKKNNHVMIMTKEASMINDELKKNINTDSNRNSRNIFKPNPNK